MCGRFVRRAEVDQIVREFSVQTVSCDLKPSYNVAPTQDVAIIVDDAANDRGRQLLAVRWGLVPAGSPDLSVGNRLINARAETLHVRPSFKDAFYHRRCLVIADAFIEWKKAGKDKMPMLIGLKEEPLFGFAGLYETWRAPDGRNIMTCTVITTDANEIVRPIHDLICTSVSTVPPEGALHHHQPTLKRSQSRPNSHSNCIEVTWTPNPITTRQDIAV
ncbi:MAG TPA: SOS response-associated peptidase [Blastocatellia bacterium]|nr:SOS response-associated peptidase [Blastocatellia bacterium]